MINKFRYRKQNASPNIHQSPTCDLTKVINQTNSLERCKKPKKNALKVSTDSVKASTLERCSTKTKDKSVVLNCNKNAETLLDYETKNAFRELFSQLQFSNEAALSPDALRKALAESFSDQQRFQLGFMDDAAECFENMLLRIHMHIAHGESQDMCSAPHCIPHQKFAMNLVEQTVCGSCGASSEALSYTQMVHYVSTSTLVYQVRNGSLRANGLGNFGKLLRKAGNMGDVRVCPSACGAVNQISRTLMNWPEIISIGLVWNSERPSLEHIMEVFSTIGTSMLLSDVFPTVMDKRWTDTCMHNLVGVVTYYGKHYSTFFFHTKLRVWIYFDDATVRQVGPHWEQVVEKCRKGRYQPLLLLYATPDGTPVNTEHAPKQVTQIYPTKNLVKSPQTQHSILRRSITPSPEKPIIGGNIRRAITPNPDGTLSQKPPLPRHQNDYQNLSLIQNNIYKSQGGDVVDGCHIRKEPEYVTRKSLDFGNKPMVNIHRTLSNSSSSGVEVGDNMNVPRRRDSGNWSGDRNSASSASSTTMDNPYLYLVGKVPHGNNSVPNSPTLPKSDSPNGPYDAGYDSYSLSSNDSSTMTTIQHMMKIGHLAKIPEDNYNNYANNCQQPQLSQSCDVLCDEADELLVKSRQLEDEHDLVLALALCNAAATKARAAMNAPYNNPQTLTLARMKHNTCIMRARSLHRRMTQTSANNRDNPPEIRHTREGSSGSGGRHSRQSSRDKGQHSRQNSKEMLVQEKVVPTKSIEIYATLPKKRDSLKNRLESINIEDKIEYLTTEKPQEKGSRGFFSRSKQKDTTKRDKRSRSEDRSKHLSEFSTVTLEVKDKTKKEEKEDKKENKDKSKKQHKIRRKLLMGGLIKRKNRSMPDLTDAVDNDASKKPLPLDVSVDDSTVCSDTLETSNLSGYLSEGHLEFSNPNLKKSKLMKKSFYSSAGKMLTAAKVPPPPPLRTTSQLSASKLPCGEINDYHTMKLQQNRASNGSPKYDVPDVGDVPPENQNYQQNLTNKFICNDNLTNITNTLVTTAVVHQEHRKSCENLELNDGIDVVDCMPAHFIATVELPPYPSPGGSAVHSRQASEDFPPPPPPLDLSALDEHLPQTAPPLSLMPKPNAATSGSLLSQLQNKKEQIFSDNTPAKHLNVRSTTPNESWLRELQAKQAALKIKRSNSLSNGDKGYDVVNTQRFSAGDSKLPSVRDLTTKFEPSEPPKLEPRCAELMKPLEQIAPEQIAHEIREVERINATLHDALNSKVPDDRRKPKLGKKKSVSFCDQVILVATAEEQEDDSYIPNPILERVLRSAVNKPETNAIRQEIMHLRESEAKKDEVEYVSKNFQSQKLNQNVVNVSDTTKYSQGAQETTLVKTGSKEFLDCIQQNVTYGQKVNHPGQQYVQNNPHSPQNGYPAQNNVYASQNGSYSNQNGTHPNQNGAYLAQNGNCQPYEVQQRPHQISNAQQSTNLNGSYQPSSNYNPQYDSTMQNGRQPYPSLYESRPQQQLPSPSNGNQHFEGQHRSPPQQSHYDVSPNSRPQNYDPRPMVHEPRINFDPRTQDPRAQHYPVQSPSNNGYDNQHGQYVSRQPHHYDAQNGAPKPQFSTPQAYINSQAQASYYNHHQPRQNETTQPPVQYHAQQRHSAEMIIRQSPNVMQNGNQGYHPQNRPYYQYPPSPTLSSSSKQSNGHQQVSRMPNNNGIYSSVPFLKQPQSNGVAHQQRAHSNDYPAQQNGVYQRLPARLPINHESEVNTRVPPLHGGEQYHQMASQQQQQKPYVKKSVSFESSTPDDRHDISIAKAVVTPILVNNANNSIPDKTKCNLCRKKIVASSNLYCMDCEYYMSRFMPKT